MRCFIFVFHLSLNIFEQTVEVMVVWDAVTLMWRHSREQCIFVNKSLYEIIDT